MSRLLMAGWETGDIAQIGAPAGAGGAALPTVVSSVPTPRSGSYCLKCFPNSSNLNAYSTVFIPHATLTEVYYAFGLYRSNSTESATLKNSLCFATVDNGGNANVVLSCENDGSMRAYYGSAGGARPTVAQLVQVAGSSAGAIPLATWTLVELRVVASTTTTGTCELRINGVTVFNVSGVRTAQANNNFGGLRLEYWRNDQSFGITAAPFAAFDDLRVNSTAGSVNNSWAGDGSIRVLVPNGVGTTIGGTALTGVPGSPNWQNVDEIPPSGVDYNQGTAIGTGETYALTDPPATGGAQALSVIVQANNVTTGGGAIGITIKTPAGTSEGAAQPITATAAYYQRVLEVDPSDAGAWSSAKLTALEAGITIR